MLLRRPGSTVRALVPSTAELPESERVYAEVRVLDHGDKVWVDGLNNQNLGDFEIARRVIGRFITSIDGIVTEDGTPYEMAREHDGYLTNDSAAWLIPLFLELVAMIRTGATLNSVEKKPCSAP